MRKQIGPWATPLLAVAEIALVLSGALAVRTALVVGMALEAAFWFAALSRTVGAARRFRAERAAGTDGWSAAEAALALLVPRPLARVLLVEPRLLVCLVRWASGHHEARSPGSFGYHRNLRGLLAGIVALVVCEGAVAEAVLASLAPGSPWVWVALGAHLYALAWLLGFSGSMVVRPHRICSEALLVRDGILGELAVPLSAITGVRLGRRANVGRSGLKVDPGTSEAMIAAGDANVVVDLCPAGAVRRGGLDDPLHVASLRITVDDPSGFVEALRSAALGSGRFR